MEEYNLETQKIFLRFLISEPDLWARSNQIIEPVYFHNSLRKSVKFIKEYAAKYNGVPSPQQIKAHSSVDLDLISGIKESDKDWLLDNIETFCRHKALEKWLVDGVDLVQKGNYGKLEQGLKDAILISLNKNLGINFWQDPKTTIEEIRNSNGQVSTGWSELDRKLYGGMNRGELHLFIGNSGAGKSLFLQNLSLNYALAGLNVAYISIELEEKLICLRMYAMATGMGTQKIFKKIDEVDTTIKLKGKNSGQIWVKQLPSGSNTNQIKAYLKEIEIKTGVRPDVVAVDYLDLLMPNDSRISPSDLFVKDKFISEELRGAAIEGLGPDHRFICISASQFNRSGVEEVDFNHANIAGGKSKIDTSDGAYGIYTSKLMRESGRYQLQMLKLRNSAGTGEKIDLSYNVETMRIIDADPDEDIEEVTSSDIMTSLKNKSKASKKKENDENDESNDIEASAKPKTAQPKSNVLELLKKSKQK